MLRNPVPARWAIACMRCMRRAESPSGSECLHRRDGWRVRLLTRPAPKAGPTDEEVLSNIAHPMH